LYDNFNNMERRMQRLQGIRKFTELLIAG